MFIICKNGFYLYNSNPNLEFWVESVRLAARFRSRVFAQSCAEYVGGVVVQLSPGGRQMNQVGSKDQPEPEVIDN